MLFALMTRELAARHFSRSSSERLKSSTVKSLSTLGVGRIFCGSVAHLTIGSIEGLNEPEAVLLRSEACPVQATRRACLDVLSRPLDSSTTGSNSESPLASTVSNLRDTYISA